ncbi:hypothetical protein F5B22DRAFT_486667 [Xylaria bambusicola]|uniref:uncharacterized protein n=1 Tax=Xylaria bambusicola TaxID=326684 RepID=UPI0020080CCF|nr:uncharacterized protein F5B22DRAFT_486667 [Xylaria bambusicola]KAI0506019.1 hypothetical protein F5B22DRAFT_486667 [Xylaria bambusicola]
MQCLSSSIVDNERRHLICPAFFFYPLFSFSFLYSCLSRYLPIQKFATRHPRFSDRPSQLVFTSEPHCLMVIQSANLLVCYIFRFLLSTISLAQSS